MHALHAALSARKGPVSPSVAELLTALHQAGPELTVMDVQISSFGGVGSTQLSNHLNAYGITTNLLTDSDNLRHCPSPPDYAPDPPPPSTSASASAPTPAPESPSEPTRASAAAATDPLPAVLQPCTVARPRHVVYLYGDPLAAVGSHYRRGHACHQAQKTSGNPAGLSAATFPASLEEYVARGEDLFGLRAHFHNWRTQQRCYPIVLLRYEHMFDPQVATQLFRLLTSHKQLPSGVVEEMAAAFTASRKPRRSKVPADMYGIMYGDLLAEMDELPPVYVRQPTSAPLAGAALGNEAP